MRAPIPNPHHSTPCVTLPGPAGYTCSANSSIATQCPAGYACPGGAVNATAVMCGVNQYSSAGASVCSNCSGGQVSSPGSSSCVPASPTVSPSSTDTHSMTPSLSPSSSLSPTASAYGPQFSLCPSGWTYFYDSAGIEGHDSCVWLSSGSALWSDAVIACNAIGMGAHMLTTSQVGSADPGLKTFIRQHWSNSDIALGASWPGNSNVSDAGWGQWSWVDGTNSSNLNCYALGCNLWQ